MSLTFTSKNHVDEPVDEIPVKEESSGSLNLKLIRDSVVIKEVQIYRAVGEGKITRTGV